MFDPSREHQHHQPKNSFDLYDETRHETWEATNSNNLWPSKKPQLGMTMDTKDDEFRWTMNGNLSPVSRTEAIIKGQKELMEMVRNMPESNYELSLKDLVEHHYRDREENTEENEEEKKILSSVYGGNGKKVEMKKNGKIDRGGFYLKVGLPFFCLESKKDKKKKKKESKVSLKPSIHNGSVKEKEWWKKSTPSVFDKDGDDSVESSIISNGSIKSSDSSSSSNSSSSRRLRSSSSRRMGRSNSIRQEKGGVRCWPLFRKLKSQKKK